MRLLFPFVFCALALAGCVAAASSSFSGGNASSAESQEASSPPPADTAAAPRFGPQALERALHRAVNRAREAQDQAPLAWSDSLHRLARSHSRDMARRGFFGHATPGGATPTDRAQRLGFPATRPLGEGRRITVGENLFRTSRYEEFRDVYRRPEDGPARRAERVYDWKSKRELARQTVEGWMDSPSHRRTLLSPHYRRHGLGVAFADEWIYVTQNLF